MKRPSNKNILLILSLFLIFMIIGTATAADDSLSNDNDEVLTVDNSTVSEDIVSTDTSENTEELTEGDSDTGSFAELETYINDNKGYEKTVYLNKDYVFNNETDTSYNDTGIYITTFLDIDGQGHTIDAKNNTMIFNIIGKKVTLKNIIFKNTNYRAIEISGSDAHIINCTFERR